MSTALAVQPDVPRVVTPRAGVVLRPYQEEAVEAVFQWVAAFDGNPLVAIPTGGGKSLLMGSIVGRAMNNAPGTRALILAHRKELIQQNVKAVATVLPLSAIGIYSAGLKRKDIDAPIIVAGIQSLARNPYVLEAFDLVLIDEAHLVPPTDDTMYRKTVDALMRLNPHVRLIGLTATPYRMGAGMLHRGKGALFTDIAYEASVSSLVADGYLCRLISKATLAKLDTAGVATRGGEFVPGALERAVDVDELTARVVDETLSLATGRNKILVFCAGVSHAQHVAEAFRAAGCAASTVHGELDAGTRAERLAAFRRGELRALVSVDILTTGYDEPAIDCVVMLRPTKSPGLYVQMAGRGFRLHPSKQDTLVLDFSGNVAQHGPVDRIEIRERKAAGDGTAPTKTCPDCQSILYAGTLTCPDCGHEFPPPEKPPLLPTASLLPVLSDEEVEPDWAEVTDVQYCYHQPKDDNKPPSLRVEYYHGFRRVASEWICVQHTGYARAKAEGWWARRSEREAPTTVDDALEIADELLRPTAIATVPEGRYTRIVDYRLPEIVPPSALPRACWTCDHWRSEGKTCALADATPPADVQATGCDGWADVEVPF